MERRCNAADSSTFAPEGQPDHFKTVPSILPPKGGMATANYSTLALPDRQLSPCAVFSLNLKERSNNMNAKIRLVLVPLLVVAVLAVALVGQIGRASCRERV